MSEAIIDGEVIVSGKGSPMSEFLTQEELDAMTLGVSIDVLKAAALLECDPQELQQIIDSTSHRERVANCLRGGKFQHAMIADYAAQVRLTLDNRREHRRQKVLEELLTPAVAAMKAEIDAQWKAHRDKAGSK